MRELYTATTTSTPNSNPRLIHAQAIKSAITDRSFYNSLITLYSKSNLLSKAVRIFHHHIPSPNVVSWTALISAYASTSFALLHFISMLRHPTLPNQRTLASLLKTCASLPSLSFGLQLHSLSLKLSLSAQPFVGSALVNFYSKCRLPLEACRVFDEITQRDEVCFAALIVGLAQNAWPVDGTSGVGEMKACNVGSTMYSVSGALRLHQSCGVGAILNEVAWNAMMAGYAQQGDQRSVVELFNSMEARGLVPDEYSFLAILTSLYNAGLVGEAEWWLTRMKVDYGLEPGLEHYTCLVGAMGRAGQLEDAERVAMTMPFEPDAAVWRALLSSCAMHGAADMAWAMGRRLMQLDPQDDSAYVIVANVLATNGRWDEVAEVRKMMKDRMVKKEGGRSWIEVRGKVHVFLAGDRRHERSHEIYAKLVELMEKIEELGYSPVLKEMLHEVEEGVKKETLWYHSEKLAVAFGVVSDAAPPGKALRIVKNLRICKDCHEAFKYISCVVEREIIVRDVNRYHRFLNGTCTCGDYW
ncbi:putative pentatricopeptide repeat-containing protein [Vitis vinifera]|uniref:Putative pentatricopeptide repeat-containing protein n=1 Tax=Vitis vinifera TaxID=29760 RepID=A0A438JV98_VITVI|nr:putative pentatricopeptide repeat-containing protein [Vitis vinifera]